MKKILSLLLALITLQMAWAQGGSGAGYDPSNPPDPQANYRIMVTSSPLKGGDTWPSGRLMLEVGEKITLEAHPREGYEFHAWMEGNEILSTEQYFEYVMPKRNVVLTAWFDFVGYGEHNPENPGDPFLDGYMHWVRAYSSPSVGGWFSNNNFRLIEGTETTIYAYPNNGYRFSNWKHDGKIISTDPSLRIKMEDKNLEFTATFVYDPQNPEDPGVNSWNRGTGELIIDHFQPGNLWDVVCNTLGWTDFDLVTSVVVIGNVNSYDLGCFAGYNFPNLDVIDFSRTSGCNYVPSWAFQECSGLTKILLPSSIQNIGSYAFYNLPNLSELIMYPVMPPEVDDYSFVEIPSDLVVKVYSGSLDLYENAHIWKNYKIMTIDEESISMTVYLPEDVKPADYRNAALLLSNLSTGQTSKMIITGSRNKYIFGNLIPDMKYNLYALAPNGSVLGSMLELELPENSVVTLPSLKKLHEVKMEILSPEGENVADRSAINWFDNSGKLIGSGPSLPSRVTGEKISYEITLPYDLAVLYLMPEKGDLTVNDEDNRVKVKLEKLPPVVIEGCVADQKEPDTPVAGAYVTVSQNINGNYPVSSTVETDDKGRFKLNIYDLPGILTAGSSDYIESTLEFQNLADAKDKAQILLKALAGTEIYVNLLKRSNILKNSTDNEFISFTDYANVKFEVKNITTGEILDFNIKYPRLVLSQELSDGEKIAVTATPTKSNFNPDTVETVIKEGKGEVKLAFITNGEIQASFKDTEAERVTGLLYGEKGNLHMAVNYEGNKARFKNLSAGKYTLLTVQESKLFSSMGSLDELSESPLLAGRDYLVNDVTVEDGYISLVELATVPVFDESLFYYTSPQTSVTVNKRNVTVGANVTVRSKIEFLPEFSDVEKVKVIFTIPEGCDYVDNSLLVAGGGANFVTISSDHISVEVPVADASPRFCIIPRKSGDFRPSAVIEFEHDNQIIRQPVGSALFTAGDFMISVPERTGTPAITARGTSPALSEVRVYDNDVYVGSTHSLSNGDWRFKFDLFKPGEDGTEHFIYGAITAPDGNKYNTSTGKTTYYHGTGILTDIDMVYGGTNIDFNHVEASTEPGSYSYVPGNDMFTFMAIFRDGLGSNIRKLDFVILLSDGSRRRISGRYLLGTETWTCALSFPDVNRLPVNVKVIYSDDPAAELIDDIEEIWRCPDVIPIIDPSGYVYEAVYSNRVEGVTATIYYRDYEEDMYGDVIEKSIKWDAAAYAQENPLFTDADGMYQWDVPSGDWQVRFEKEGYETARTEWLPVPPPQLDVNVAISEMSSPNVKRAAAYPASMEIEFDKYMDPLTLNTRNIKVLVEGKEVPGVIRLLNEEQGDNEKSYASVILFLTDDEQPFGSDEVELLISKVKSYAGVQMEEAYSQKFSIETQISAIVSPAATNAYVGYDKTITVKVEPAQAAAGRKLILDLSTPIIGVEKSFLIDEEGKVEINIHGDLPGKAQIRYSIEDVYLDKDYLTDINVDIINAEIPESSVESGSQVYRNTEVEIYTDSRIGDIYYTLDGSLPTETTGILYTGPITIPDAVTIRAVNVINEAVYSVSDVADFSFSLKRSAINHETENGWNWISHNLENSINIEKLTVSDNIEQILSKTQSLIRDPKYGMIGSLKELKTNESYKVKSNSKGLISGAEDISLNPASPVPVLAGWNWISYPVERSLSISEALITTEAEEGDIIVGQNGFATNYDGENWIGDLNILEPSKGYMYFSKSSKDIVYNAFSKSGASMLAPSVTDPESHWKVDRRRYPSLMPVIAEVVYSNGVVVPSSEYEVAAFCDDECRGIGVYVNGFLFISIYGNEGDNILFRLYNKETDEETRTSSHVKFTEDALGTLNDPFRIGSSESGTGETFVIGDLKISVRDNILYVRGENLESVRLYDMEGLCLASVKAESEINIPLDFLNPGVYVVGITDKFGNIFRNKVMVR